MLRKLRRRWAHKSIRKFLIEYLPKIGLGEVEEFKCIDFRLGKYSLKTTKGIYSINFWELNNSAKEFHIDLCEWKSGEWERITFSITGNVWFKIVPCEFTIDRDDKRQVTNLLTGRTEIYPLGKCDCDNEYITYNRPIIMSRFVYISKLRNIAMDI